MPVTADDILAAIRARLAGAACGPIASSRPPASTALPYTVAAMESGEPLGFSSGQLIPFRLTLDCYSLLGVHDARSIASDLARLNDASNFILPQEQRVIRCRPLGINSEADSVPYQARDVLITRGRWELRVARAKPDCAPPVALDPSGTRPATAVDVVAALRRQLAGQACGPVHAGRAPAATPLPYTLLTIAESPPQTHSAGALHRYRVTATSFSAEGNTERRDVVEALDAADWSRLTLPGTWGRVLEVRPVQSRAAIDPSQYQARDVVQTIAIWEILVAQPLYDPRPRLDYRIRQNAIWEPIVE